MNQLVAAQRNPHLLQEDILLRSYDQLQTALSIGMIATWFWNIGSDRVYGDSNLFQLFGIQGLPTEDGLPLNTFTDAIHADDRSLVVQLIEDAMRLNRTYEAEYRIVTGTGTIKWVLARGRLAYTDQNEPSIFSGVLVDVTDRKKAEIHAQEVEGRLRLAIESAKLGTWELNPITNELTWSDRTKELFGLPVTASVDYPTFIQGIHPTDRDRVERTIQDSLESGSGGHYAIEYRTVGLNDGKIRWLQANGQAFFDEHGQANGLTGTVIDITANKRTEEILQQRVAEQTQVLERQTHQLRTTLDASLNSIIAMTAMRDQTGSIVDFMMDTANEAVIKSNFMTPDQIIGRSLLTVFPGNRENGFFDLYIRVVTNGQAEQSLQYYRDKFGLEGWFEVSAVKQGNDGVVVTYNNVTDRKKVEIAAQQQENELKEAVAELKRSNENLQQFAQIASHDLQEPLRRIQAFSDMLQSQFVDNLSDGEKDMVRRIQKSARRMQMLIRDLLAYSQLTTQREPFSPVSLTSVLTDVISDLEMTITEKKASIDVAPLPVVLGSTSRLRQLFQNLIINALKFSKPDQVPMLQIRVEPAQAHDLPPRLHDQQESPFWLITIIDNGIGFDEKYKDRIFTPFQRLHDPTKYSGTGIGLAICQRVAESHGGAIDVTSQPGAGSTFRVFLPVADTNPD
ncbi:PAS domain-containing sensor histidine kinase [Spirosoma agri]|uniref:histidine kinase n=1 Tax=Spirosoma agri TaxID=1987381 RepID=A0A6M0IDE7_9BACT|nr:PAS domain-containing protein [Spirosoma agri]NEU66198.1 PAS domain-containing protein [Spirosoma agri]